MSLLLDTQVVIWLAYDPSRVPTAVQEAISTASTPVLVSAVVTWEVAIKSAKGKLKVGEEFLDRLRTFAFTPLPISDAHAWAVRRLPDHHRDPFDRLLVAQAQAERATLVSADAQLREYDVPVLWS